MYKGPTAGIILAAGMSTRLGSLKQLAKIGDSTLLSMVVNAAIKSNLDRVVLVLGYKADTIKASMGGEFLNTGMITVVNPRYQEGMSTSLQCGLEQVLDEFPSIMVLMGDQPFLHQEIINLILRVFLSSGKDICAPVHNGQRGLPVCFTKRFYKDIFAVKGDMGAREVIRNNPEDIISAEIEDPESFLDIDDKNDFEKIQLLIKSRS